MGIHFERDVAAVVGRRDIGASTAGEGLRWNFGGRLRRLQFKRFPICAGECIGERVERQSSGQGKSSHELSTTDKVHSCRLSIVASREVAVIRSHDGIGYAYRLTGPTPLADAGAASIRQNDAVYVFERLHLAIAFYGG